MPTAGPWPVATKNVPDDHQRAPDDEHAGLAKADVLEPDRRGDVEDRDEQPAEGERRDEPGRAGS